MEMKIRISWTTTGRSVVEVITTSSVIVILASLLVSSLFTANEKSKMAICINNLKDLAAGLIFQATDEGVFPEGLAQHSRKPATGGRFFAFADAGGFYMRGADIRGCPKITSGVSGDEPFYSYGMNQSLCNAKLKHVKRPWMMILVAESRNRPVLETTEDVDFRHLGKAVAAFADGHVQPLKQIQIRDARDRSSAREAAQDSGNGILWNAAAT